MSEVSRRLDAEFENMKLRAMLRAMLRAEGPARNKPEQSQPFALLEAYQAELVQRACDAIPSPSLPPGSPSGVVEARRDLGMAWNLLADAMHVLDAVTGSTPKDHSRKLSVHAKIEEAHGIVQRFLAPLPQSPAPVEGEACERACGCRSRPATFIRSRDGKGKWGCMTCLDGIHANGADEGPKDSPAQEGGAG